MVCYLFPKRQILYSSKLKESVDNNFKFDEYGGELSKRVENSVGKRITTMFSYKDVKTRACLGMGYRCNATQI